MNMIIAKSTDHITHTTLTLVDTLHTWTFGCSFTSYPGRNYSLYHKFEDTIKFEGPDTVLRHVQDVTSHDMTNFSLISSNVFEIV